MNVERFWYQSGEARNSSMERYVWLRVRRKENVGDVVETDKFCNSWRERIGC